MAVKAAVTGDDGVGMVLIWGFKRTERGLGYAADFCTMCRDVVRVRVFRVGEALHFYYVSGNGRLVRHIAKCQGCDNVTTVTPERYASLERSARVDLTELERQTFPDLRQRFSGRLAIEQELRAGNAELTPELRRQLIHEPFESIAPLLRERCARWHVDRRAGLTMLASVLVPAAVVMSLHEDMSYDLRDSLQLAAVGVFLLGSVVSMVLLLTDVPRLVRRLLLPQLANTLRILQPSRQELEQCQGQLREHNTVIAKKVRMDRLYQLIEIPADRRDDEALLARQHRQMESLPQLR